MSDKDKGPFMLERAEQAKPKPIAGTVSLRELEHSIPEKALRAARQGQRYARQNNTSKAIHKLEQAVRLAPSFRDAHNDLGVQYAAAKRFNEARAEFQRALEIGPPAAPIYLNLGLSSAALGNLDEAKVLARKALELDARNIVAQQLLHYLSAH